MSGIDVELLGRALSLEWGPFWRETPIEDPNGVHSWEARFDKAAFTEAVVAEYDRLVTQLERVERYRNDPQSGWATGQDGEGVAG